MNQLTTQLRKSSCKKVPTETKITELTMAELLTPSGGLPKIYIKAALRSWVKLTN